MDIPKHPADATPAWVTAVLREAGVLSNSSVTAVETETIGEGVGILGELGRLSLTYDRPEPGAPLSVVLKLPSQHDANRALGMMFGFYEREVRFYREIAPKTDLRVPRCYWSYMGTEAAEFALLLEDFGHMGMADQVAGVSPERALLAVEKLAHFHATWWESPVLDSLTWMPPTNSAITKQVGPAYRDAWPSFLANFGDDLPDGSVPVGERVGAEIERLLDEGATSPLTICHADFRLDNLFFGRSGDADPVALIDFQLCVTGRGVFDVAYLLCQSMQVDDRRASEMTILKRWHDVITAEGVTGYSLEDALSDYKRSALICLCYPVTSGGTLDLANERGVALVRAMAVRSFSAALDLEAEVATFG